MEFSLSLAAGTAGGLAASLLLRVIWQWIATAPATNTLSRAAWSELEYVALHAFWGAGLGLLFWLSWGLTALIGVSWWLRGLAFGLLCSGIIVAPLLLMARLLLNWPWLVALGLLLDALSTSALVGLICAWNWTHAA